MYKIFTGGIGFEFFGLSNESYDSESKGESIELAKKLFKKSKNEWIEVVNTESHKTVFRLPEKTNE